MPINFPASPTINQTFTSGPKTWTWDGSSWVSSSGTFGGITKIEVVVSLPVTQDATTLYIVTG